MMDNQDMTLSTNSLQPQLSNISITMRQQENYGKKLKINTAIKESLTNISS
jgi:hypothetical protein